MDPTHVPPYNCINQLFISSLAFCIGHGTLLLRLALRIYFQDLDRDQSIFLDEETDDLLVEIESLTSQVLRETSLWNLQIHQARQYVDNGETVKYDDNHNGEVEDYNDETDD